MLREVYALAAVCDVQDTINIVRYHQVRKALRIFFVVVVVVLVVLYIWCCCFVVITVVLLVVVVVTVVFCCCRWCNFGGCWLLVFSCCLK